MNALDVDTFHGRRVKLDLLKKRVLDLKEGYRQNIAFVGTRFIGKSSLLQKFVSDLDDKDIISVYLDMENKDFDYLYRRIAGSILYNFAKAEGLPLHHDIPLLLESVHSRLPHTAKVIKRIQSLSGHSKTTEAYRELIALPQTFAKEADKFCLLILDAFENLQELGIANAFQELGKRVMTQKRCLYIVTSSYPGVAQRILSEKLSLLFGNFEVIHIRPFDLKTSHAFIRSQFKDIKLGEQLDDFLVEFTGGHPLYLRLICQEAKTLMAVHSQREIFMPLMFQAIEDILFNPRGMLGTHFQMTASRLCEGRSNLMVAHILMALADGKRKLRDLVTGPGMKQSQVKQKLARLAEIGIVHKNGNYYYMDDKLLRYWLKYVFAKQWRSLVNDPAQERLQFREELTRSFEDFRLNLQRDLSSRIVELLHCFEEESLQINGRRYKLPLFRNIVRERLQDVSDEPFEIIKASSANGDWVIVLKMGAIGENDVNEVVRELKKYAQKPQKCILISLATIDDNVRVRALQERMWIWNEGELNTLLTLFDKPYIMTRET